MIPPLNTTPELSDDDRSGSVARSANRRRSTRACDQCRRTKSKCERSDVDNVCRACAAMGVSCTYVGPSHKRGPPKGYILALERRLHQVEALLGTIIGSDDPRARTLIDDLARDQLAAHIIRRVKTGPFGPRGRLTQPFGSTKEDFLAAIMTGPGDESPRSNYGEENYALVSPDRDWQDRLQSLLQVPAPQTRISQPSYNQAPTASQQYALPPFRQLSSPVHHSSTQQQPHYGLQGSLGGYSTPTKHESPVSATAMLAPLQQTQQQSVPSQTHGGQSTNGYTATTANDSSAYTAARWDGFNGYSRIPDDVLRDDSDSKRSSYELVPPSQQHHQASASGGQRDAYQAAMPRCGSATTADTQRWFFGPDTAVS